MKRLATGLATVAMILAACGQAAPMPTPTGLSLSPPTPAGMVELKPEVAPLPDAAAHPEAPRYRVAGRPIL